MTPSPQRQIAVDVYRGLVMLLLLPDLYGGFSFYEVARRIPGDPVWGFLAKQFSHAAWSGMHVWDFIQPSFVFVAGAAMALSVAARRARGESRAAIFAHVLVRAVALLVLSLIFRFDLRTRAEEAWPLGYVLALGLPFPRWIGRLLSVREPQATQWATWIWEGAVIGASAALVAARFALIRDQDLFSPILSQIALVTPFAFLATGRSVKTQAAIAVGILAAYGLAFALWPLPGPGFDPLSVGVHPGDEWFHGLFAHWNKGTNLAAAFDVRFLNLLPRSHPYVFNDHGLQTLNFVPTISTMVFGMMAGDLLRGERPKHEVRAVLLRWGVAGIAAGLIASGLVCPSVKSIWTPSWALLSGGLAGVTLAIIYQAVEIADARIWAAPLAVLGTNSILLYTVSSEYRWWPLVHLNTLAGGRLFQGPVGPFYESLTFLAFVWLAAYALYRARIFVKF
jgi:predicted acyltransferase